MTLRRAESPQRHNSKIRRAVSFFKHIGRKSCVHDLLTEPQEQHLGLDAGKPTLTGNNRLMPEHTGINQDTCTQANDSESLLTQANVESTLQARCAEQSPGLPEGFSWTSTDRSAPKVPRSLTSSICSEKGLLQMQRTRRRTLYDMEGNALSPLTSLNFESSEEDIAELATDDPLFNSSQLGDTSVLPLTAGFLPEEQRQMNNGPRLPTHYGPFSLSLCASKAEDELRAYWPAITWKDHPHTVNSEVEKAQVENDDAQMQDVVSTGISFRGSEPEHCPATPPVKSSRDTEVSKHITENSRAEDLVQELHKLVRGLNYFWSEEVLHHPEAPVLQASIHGMSAFEAGMRSLQQCFRGSLATTVEGVLSLVQVALSCAYELYEQDLAFPWHDLLEDIIDWRHALSAEEDRQLYVNTVKVLWAQMQAPALQESPVHISGSNTISQQTCMSIPESILQNTSLHRSEPTEVPMMNTDLALWPTSEANANEGAILESRKRGLVIRTCSRYLNGKLHRSIVAKLC